MTAVQEPLAPPPAAAPATPSRPSTRARAATTVPAGVDVAVWIVAAISGLCLGFLAFLLVLSPLQQARSQDLLYAEFRDQLAAATAPFEAEPITPGAPVGIIEAKTIGLRQVVVEGTGGRDLRAGPGHSRASAFPGQPGQAVLIGRSTTYGAPFGDIDELAAGDRIDIVTGQGAFTYVVDGVRRDGDPVPLEVADGESRLTLVTAAGDPLRPSSTVYVDADLQGYAAVAPPRVPLLVPPFEAPMASDLSALLPLALWLLLLLAVAGFVAWGVTRWGRLQTWVVAAPLTLAAIWGASDAAALLLPNLM